MVVRRLAVRDADRAVPLQRLRRGRAVLVHLQRAAILPEVSIQGGEAHSAVGELVFIIIFFFKMHCIQAMVKRFGFRFPNMAQIKVQLKNKGNRKRFGLCHFP